MRMPSENLVELLTEFHLCGRKEIAACESRVRRLCHDLPDFDSVWLDALAQIDVITPWQAEIIQSNNPHQLQVGRFILREPLGEKTFLAKSTTNNRLAVLRKVQCDSKQAVVLAACENLIEDLDECRASVPTSLELPRELITQGDDIYLASRFVSGYSADELLIRGGRLPSTIVREIGRQLLDAARWLEEHRKFHGNISLKNVRIQSNGEMVLVAPFVTRLETPHVSFSPDLQLSAVDAIAPENVSTGLDVNSQSELYSVGCVLWQLLTSRSTFLSADPINRVLKSQNSDVADVRSIVPDCPDWIAQQIQTFTRRSPSLRPASIAQAQERWSRAGAGNGVTATRKLLKRLPDRQHRSRVEPHERLKSAFLPIVAATTMIAAFCGYGVYRGLLPMPLKLGSQSTSAERPKEIQKASQVSTERETPHEDRSPHGYLKMPRPDAAGVVVLKSGHTYEASPLTFDGVLHVESTDSTSAVVVVPRSGWSITASQISLSYLQVEELRDTPTPNPSPPERALIDCRCDVLAIRSSLLSGGKNTSCVRWQALAGVTGVVQLENVILQGPAYGLWMTNPADRCELRNILATTSGAAMRYDVDGNGKLPTLRLANVTQVGGKATLDLIMQEMSSKTLRLETVCGESVLAPTSALVRIAGPMGWRANHVQVSFLLPERGNPTIVPPAVNPVVHYDRSLKKLVRLDESQVMAQSLLLAEPSFRRPIDDSGHTQATPNFEHFELLDYEGPKLSSQLPGVDVTQLPTPVTPTQIHAID